MTCSRLPSTSPVRNCAQSATESAQTSAIEASPRVSCRSVTARISGLSRVPPQTGHGTSRM